MPGPVFDDEWGYSERSVHDRAHAIKHAIKRMERDMKCAENEKMHAVKDAVKREARMYREMGRQGPRTVDEVLVEVDSYISYLEDLPKDKLAPYGDKFDRLAEHLEKVRNSFKADARAR